MPRRPARRGAMPGPVALAALLVVTLVALVSLVGGSRDVAGTDSRPTAGPTHLVAHAVVPAVAGSLPTLRPPGDRPLPTSPLALAAATLLVVAAIGRAGSAARAFTRRAYRTPALASPRAPPAAVAV